MMKASAVAHQSCIETWDRTAVWHGFTQMADYEPLVISQADGNWLIDVRGRRLLDGVSSLWCNLHGHNHPRINQAIIEQLQRVAHVTSLGMGCDTTAELAHRLVEIAPGDLQHVFFSSDGSSAVEAAIKLAFQYWQQSGTQERTKFAALGAAYHGDTTGSVSLGGMDLFHRMFAPMLFDVIRGPLPTCYRLPAAVDQATACRYYLDQFEQTLAPVADQLAAIIIEPLVQGAAGLVVHPQGFLAGVRQLADKFGCLLICDEVATGFGRTGKMFACQWEDVAPDLLCIGKGLTGGYLPMAATLTTNEIWRAFLGRSAEGKQFFHGHTFSGNPLAAAAALASLEIFDEQQTLETLPEKAAQLAAELDPIRHHPHVGDIRQLGMMVGIELVEDRQQKRPFASEQRRGMSVCRRALEDDVWIRPLGDVVVLMPPLSIRSDEITQLTTAVCRAVINEFAVEELVEQGRGG